MVPNELVDAWRKAGTRGAEFAPGLAIAPGDVVISKATRPDRDAYSALDGTPLAEGKAMLRGGEA